MSFGRFYLLILLLILMLGFVGKAAACGTCTIPRLGKDESTVRTESHDKKWYFEYLFEQKNWDKMDARDAHQLHHQGHHFHDKTTEDYHHLSLGRYVTEDFKVFAEIPYVIRRSLEIDNHSILGSQQKSKGFGDLNLIGNYRFWKDDKQSLSFVGGVKFPTGETKEENSVGTRFEPELQPGSGSYDYVAGGIFKINNQRVSWTGNMTYVFTTEGAQNFEYGDIFTASLFGDYLINPDSARFKARTGIDMIYQNERRQKDAGVKVMDSGGEAILAGPVIKVTAHDGFNLLGSLLHPVYQNLGGVHQELDFEWMLGGELRW